MTKYNSSRFTLHFWLLNVLQMLEKLAYVIVLYQMPIYIAQKDQVGGLHFDQTVKGVIFFWWALVQNIVPIFSGAYADKYGRKKIIAISLFFSIIGYFLLFAGSSFGMICCGVVVLGSGSGLFKPALQGALAANMHTSNERIGWSAYFMLLNLSVFFAAPLTIYLKSYSFALVFLGSAGILFINLILLFFIKIPSTQTVSSGINSRIVLRKTLEHLKKPELFIFVIIMSGFAIVYMQFYETMPNFISDWTDTSSLAQLLPKFMQTDTSRGTMISFEWLYNINTILIIIGVVALAAVFKKIQRLNIISLGIFIASIGLFASAWTMNGAWLVAGFVVYTFGEMLTNPRFNEHLSSLAGIGEKSTYLGFLNLSFAIGLGGGSLLGGYLYQHYSEKAMLAQRYLIAHNIEGKIIPLSESFQKLMQTTGLNSAQATSLLWQTYQPWHFWLVFLAIGIVSSIAILFYKKKYAK